MYRWKIVGRKRRYRYRVFSLGSVFGLMRLTHFRRNDASQEHLLHSAGLRVSRRRFLWPSASESCANSDGKALPQFVRRTPRNVIVLPSVKVRLRYFVFSATPDHWDTAAER